MQHSTSIPPTVLFSLPFARRNVSLFESKDFKPQLSSKNWFSSNHKLNSTFFFFFYQQIIVCKCFFPFSIRIMPEAPNCTMNSTTVSHADIDTNISVMNVCEPAFLAIVTFHTVSGSKGQNRLDERMNPAQPVITCV